MLDWHQIHPAGNAPHQKNRQHPPGGSNVKGEQKQRDRLNGYREQQHELAAEGIGQHAGNEIADDGAYAEYQQRDR
ncbi:hypothetical protein D3C79_766330 [compost metagenome]